MTREVVTTSDAAALLDVPRNLISLWRHRELVTPVGLIPGRGRGAPLYDLTELRPLADRYHARRAAASMDSSTPVGEAG